MYYESPRFEGTALHIADRIYRDIWSTREALRELAEDGILAASASSEPVYRYRPLAQHREPIFRLAQSYNEPLERDQIQRALREIASYAPYRRATQGSFMFDRLPSL
jgi:hypothetical protein